MAVAVRSGNGVQVGVAAATPWVGGGRWHGCVGGGRWERGDCGIDAAWMVACSATAVVALLGVAVGGGLVLVAAGCPMYHHAAIAIISSAAATTPGLWVKCSDCSIDCALYIVFDGSRCRLLVGCRRWCKGCQRCGNRIDCLYSRLRFAATLAVGKARPGEETCDCDKNCKRKTDDS